MVDEWIRRLEVEQEQFKPADFVQDFDAQSKSRAVDLDDSLRDEY